MNSTHIHLIIGETARFIFDLQFLRGELKIPADLIIRSSQLPVAKYYNTPNKTQTYTYTQTQLQST